MGRLSTYTDAIADEICLKLSEGKSLLSICRAGNMPPESTVRLWALDDRGGFAAKYARARDMQADRFAEQIVDIADTEPDAAKARNRMDARKWYASKVAPKKYGEKIDVNHTGEVVTRHDLTGYSPDELDTLEKLVGKATDRAGDSGGESPPGSDRVH